MIEIRALDSSNFPNDRPAEVHCYRIAGLMVTADTKFRLLQPFFSDTLTKSAVIAKEECVSAFPMVEALYENATLTFGGKEHAVRVAHRNRLHFIEIESLGRFVADEETLEACLLDSNFPLDSDQIGYALLSPPFFLLAASRDRFILHASSAMFGDRYAVFIGVSGRGKSTLAAFLDKRVGWRRVSDDMLPISDSETGLTGYPRFPQYKIPTDQQPSLNVPSKLPVSAIYVLQTPDSTNTAIEIVPASTAQAATAMLSHTIGTTLFDPRLLQTHFSFSTRVAETTPIRFLRYPRSFDALPNVAEAIERDLTQM